MTDAPSQAQQEGKHREEFVLQLFRLFKLATMHQLGNQAVQRSAEAAARSFVALLMQEQTKLSALFSGENIFVNGQPLKASRGTYESASELGRLLAHVGLNEITVWQEVTSQDLLTVLEQFVHARQARERRAQALMVPNRVRLHYVDPSFLLGADEGDLSPHEQLLRTYTSSVVVMRRVLEGAAQGRYELMRVVKRVGQRLVVLAQEDDQALLAMTALRTSRQDLASQAMAGAVTAILAARQLTRDLRALSDVATAALCHDLGQQRLKALKDLEDDPFGLEGAPVLLSAQDLEHAAGSSAVALIALAGLYDTSLRRLVVTHEANVLSQGQTPYQGRAAPTVEALLVSQSHLLQALLVPDEPSGQAPSTDEALARWLGAQRDRPQVAIGHLICAALGLYPRGSAARTRSGHAVVVLSNHREAARYSAPLVRVLEDPRGQTASPQRDVDLSDAHDALARELGPLVRAISTPSPGIERACAQLRGAPVTWAAATAATPHARQHAPSSATSSTPSSATSSAPSDSPSQAQPQERSQPGAIITRQPRPRSTPRVEAPAADATVWHDDPTLLIAQAPVEDDEARAQRAREERLRFLHDLENQD